MYPYSIEELARAVAREREDEVRKARSHVVEEADECDCEGDLSLPKP